MQKLAGLFLSESCTGQLDLAELTMVVEPARSLQSPTHDQLLASNGTYAALWQLQTGEE